MDKSTEKALKLLQNISSFEKINKKLLSLNQEYTPRRDCDYFAIEDYFPFVYEECIELLVELAVFMRKKSEKFKEYGESINAKVKYSNTSKYLDGRDITFDATLSKIIHATNISFELKSFDGMIGYGYAVDRNSSFTGFALICGEEKDGTKYQAKIDIIKFCVNVFMVTAHRDYI